MEKLERYRDEGKRYVKNFKDDWDEAEEFYQGIQWKQRDPSKRFRNYCFQVVESEVPLLMDPMPSTDVIPLEDNEEKKQQAIVLEAAKDHVYRQQQVAMKDVQSIRDLLKTGNGWQYVDYDPDGEGGEGSITVKNIAWNHVILDPAAENIDQCRYVGIEVPMSNDDIKRRFPKTAKEALSQPLKDIYVFSDSKFNREDQNIGTNSGVGNQNRYESKDMSFVEEWWIKDYSMIAIPDDDTQIELTEESTQLMEGINPDIYKWEDHPKHIDGHRDMIVFVVAQALQIAPEQVTEQDIEAAKQDPEIALRIAIIEDHIRMHEMHIESMEEDEIGKKPKYKNYLRLVIKTGKVIHYDDSPPCDDGLVPLVPWYCYKGQKIYADGILKNLIPLQKTINELDEKEFKGLKLCANPGWIVDEQSEVDPDTLTDEDGIVVIKKQGTEAMRLQPGVVSQQLENRSRREFEAMQRIEGVGEAVLGESPKHQVSGVLMRRLQMQSLGRIRLKSRMIESAIERRDKLIISRIIKYYSTERKLRFQDESGNIRFIQFSPDAVRDLSYEVVLAPGTMSGMDNETIAETYKEFLLGGLIDLKTYAEIANLPKKQDLFKALDAQDQVKMQLEQLQQENLALKAQFAPETLTPEEQQLLTQQPAVG